MNAIQFFLEQKTTTDSLIQNFVYAGLSDQQLRQSPHEGQNSLIWLLWHTARWEDLIVSVLDLGCPQVFDQADWRSRMNIDRGDGGTAMTNHECAAFNTRVNIAGVQAYWAAVTQRTEEAARNLRLEGLSSSVDDASLRRSLAGGMIGSEGARWVEQWLANHTVAWFLSFLILHRSEHLLGEALSIRGQGGFSLGL